ncbi:MAG: ATP-binding protein [Duncaniella sp.]|nr:ATP-binding protein [Duncaniella sp.]
MLINLNEDICGFVPERYLYSSTESMLDNGEYYSAMTKSVDGVERRCVIFVTDSDELLLHETGRLDSLNLQQKGYHYSVHHAGNLAVVAIRSDRTLVFIDELLAAGPMSWDTALPLFYEIIAERIRNNATHFYTTSLLPEHILLTKDGEELHPFTAVVTEWFESQGQTIYSAPELNAGDCPVAFLKEKTWLFAAAMLLTRMIQRDYPWKLRPKAADMSDEQYGEYYRKIITTTPAIDAIGRLRKLLERNLSASPDRRSASAGEFLHALYSIMKEKEMKLPDELVISESENPEESQDAEIPTENYDYAFSDNEPEAYHRTNEPKLKINFVRGGGDGFSEVAGLDDIKAKMTRNFISIVKNPELARTFRIEPPNGLLLWGPPGNGKSFISKKLAEESGLLYATVNPGDLGSIYIHGTQGLIADLFAKCERVASREKSGVLLVLEEFDTLVPSRASSGGDSNSRNDEVAEFLTRLNNCASKGVYVIATTNRIDAIDPAVMRKGRMDEVIYVDLPDENVRMKLFQIELKDRPHDELDLNRLVKMTDGFSSGDISYLVKESARKAFEQTIAGPDKKIVAITQDSLEDTIKNAHPSVTASERHRYEKLRESYDRHRNEQPRVGF